VRGRRLKTVNDRAEKLARGADQLRKVLKDGPRKPAKGVSSVPLVVPDPVTVVVQPDEGPAAPLDRYERSCGPRAAVAVRVNAFAAGARR
jgi:hypothetical protein